MNITPDMARAELARRELEKRQVGEAASQALADNENPQSYRQRIAKLAREDRTPIDTLRDVGGGVARGAQNIAALLGEAGGGLASILTGGRAPQVNIREQLGLEGENPIDLQGIISSSNPNPLLQGLGQYAPAIASGGPTLGGQTLAAGAYGLTQASPDQENLLGMLPNGRVGGGLSDALLAGTAGKIGKSFIEGFPGVRKAIDYFRPEKKGKEFLAQLGKGTREENAQALAADIQKSHQDKLDNALSHKNPVYEKEGESIIYENPSDSKFLKLIEENPELIGKKSKKLYEEFIRTPTLNKADKLQSQIGDEIGNLRRKQKMGNTGRAEDDVLDSLKELRDTLKEEMSGYVGKKDSNLAKELKIYSDKYRDNVIPYQEEKVTQEIVSEPKYIKKKRQDNPGLPYNITADDLQGFFSNPSREALQIAGDLGDEGINKILYGELSKAGKKDAKGLAKAISEAKQNKGLGRYVTPEMESFAEELLARAKWRDRLKYGSYGIAGALGTGAIYDAGKKLI